MATDDKSLLRLIYENLQVVLNSTTTEYQKVVALKLRNVPERTIIKTLRFIFE